MPLQYGKRLKYNESKKSLTKIRNNIIKYQGVTFMTMTLESLQAALEEYPELLKNALLRQYEANEAVEAVKEEINKSEVENENENEGEDEDTSPDSPDYEKLKLRYEQKRAQLELKVRQNPPESLKITESTVHAILQADEELCAMKERLIELEHKRREESMFSRVRSLRHEPKTSDSNLIMKLVKAQEESTKAEIEVEVLRETLESYKMLTVILTGAEVMTTSLDLS
jgi:hypothetical protein